MVLYTFKAKKLSGEEITGDREAAHKRELARSLRQEGYTLIAATEHDEIKQSGAAHAVTASISRFTGHVSLVEKLNFARNLSVMIEAGLPLTRALGTLERQTTSKAFKQIIGEIVSHIEKGESFTDALRNHPRVFPPLFIAMVAAGEVSGNLAQSLNVLGVQMKNDYDLRRKVRGAMMYPAVIMTVMLLVGILMLLYVVPTLTGTFEDLGIELPATTRAIITVSNFLVNHFLVAFMLFVFVIAGMVMAFRTRSVRDMFDSLVIRLPVIGALAKKINAARTARTMSSLIRSGVSILETLAITKEVLQNHLFRNVLEEVRESIRKGASIQEPFTKHGNLYPVLMSEMIAVGEETGKTGEMLERVAEFYEGEIAAATKDLSSIIEPVLMVFIGTVVGFFAISMITPLYTSLDFDF